MLQHKLQDLFDEPACAKNRAKDGKNLWRQRLLAFTQPADSLVGNTYGRFLKRDTGMPPIRIGFPIFELPRAASASTPSGNKEARRRSAGAAAAAVIPAHAGIRIGRETLACMGPRLRGDGAGEQSRRRE